MGIAVKQAAHAIADDLLQLPGDFPAVPDDILSRFPNTAPDWQEQQQRWWTKTQNSLSEFAGTVQDGIAMGNVLTVNGDAGAIYIRNIRGDGAWADPDTPFYVNRASFFSLGSALTWNPETKKLSVSGTIIAIAGQIGGFDIGTDYIRDAANSFGLSSVVSGADDVRFWAGDTFANRATAPFRVYESGALVATNATISGSITATSGTIGGWTINPTTLSKNNAILDSAGQLSLGTGNDIVILSATDATYRIWIGNAATGSAAFRVTKAGVMTATNGVFSGTITSTSGTIGGFTIGATTLSAGSGGGLTELSAGGTLTMGTVATSYFRIYNGGFDMFASSQQGASLYGGSTGSLELFLGGVSRIKANAGTGDVQALSFTATSSGFSGNGANLTNLTASAIVGTITNPLAVTSGTITGVTISATSAIISSGSVNATLGGNGSGITSLNASNISSGTLDNARLPSGISVTSLATSNFEASVTTAVDVKDVNFRVYNGGTQNARIDYTTGFYYVQGNAVVGARGTRGAATITEVVALLDAWQSWA